MHFSGTHLKCKNEACTVLPRLFPVLDADHIAAYGKLADAPKEARQAVVAVVLEVKGRVLFMDLLVDHGEVFYLAAVVPDEHQDLFFQLLAVQMAAQTHCIGGIDLVQIEPGAGILKKYNQLGVAIITHVKVCEFGV